MFVSVVIPVRNEEKFIAGTLDGLLAQDYPDDAFEILVADGESTDATPRIVEQYAAKDPRIRLLRNPKRWSSAARNVGVRASRGDVVVVVDGHCQFEDNRYLRHLVEVLRRHDVDCVGRPQPLDIAGGSLLQQAIATARSSSLGHHPDSFIYSDQERIVPAHSVGVAYRRHVFERVGYFDESFDACEDVEFNHRVDQSGMTCVLAPGIRLHYHPRSSLRGLARQMGRYGRGRVRLWRKHRDTFSLKSFLPAAFVLFLMVGAVASLLWSPLAWLYLIGMGTYGIVVLGYSLSLSLQNRDARLLPWLPCVFAAIHLGAGYGSLAELVLGRSRPVRSTASGDPSKAN